MAKRKLPYQEGTWFAVPLRTTGYGVGVVARLAGDGPVFGYFFGPVRPALPHLEDLRGLSCQQADWVAIFGDLGLVRKEWPVIGRFGDWSRVEWPLPAFVRVDDVSGKATRVTYSDADLSVVTEEPCDAALARTALRDGLFGYGAVETRLTRLLDVGRGA